MINKQIEEEFITQAIEAGFSEKQSIWLLDKIETREF